jgi:hypothetical protein
LCAGGRAMELERAVSSSALMHGAYALGAKPFVPQASAKQQPKIFGALDVPGHTSDTSNEFQGPVCLF